MQDTAISEMEPSIKTTHKRKTVFKSGTMKGQEWVTLGSCFHCILFKREDCIECSLIAILFIPVVKYINISLLLHIFQRKY